MDSSSTDGNKKGGDEGSGEGDNRVEAKGGGEEGGSKNSDNQKDVPEESRKAAPEVTVEAQARKKWDPNNRSSTGSAIPDHVLEKIVYCRVSGGGSELATAHQDEIGEDEKHQFRLQTPSEEQRNSNPIRAPGAVKVRGVDGSNSLRQSALREEHEILREMFGGHHACANSQHASDEEERLSINSHMTEITAVRVDDSKVKEEIRSRLIFESVQATVIQDNAVDMNEDHCFCSFSWKRVTLVVCVLLTLIAVAVVVAVTQVSSSSTSSATEKEEPVHDPRPTIDKVQERGYLRCNTWGTTSGFSFPNPETGKFEGLNVDHCRAISIALFGNPDQYEIVREEVQDGFVLLAEGKVDVVSAAYTHNMARDVLEKTSQTALTFTTPYFYSHLAFAGIPEYVECADKLDSLFGICRYLSICVLIGTTHPEHLEGLLPGATVIPVQSLEDEVGKIKDGSCNVIVSEPIFLPEKAFRELGYDGPFTLGNKTWSREPLTIQTRSDDHEWSNLIDLIVKVFFLAEAEGITTTNANDLRPLFGNDTEVADMMVAIVSELGSYADLYEKHLESHMPRQGLNMLYNPKVDQTGLLYSLPFGESGLSLEGPGPHADGSIATILSRGYLLCGVQPKPGFAEQNGDGDWYGFDVEFCRAVAAAFFPQTPDSVVFLELKNGPEQSYVLLANGDLDVVAGARTTLQADYHEPTTGGLRYVFSPPYFYDRSGTAYAMMTFEHSDYQFNDIVYWIVMALIYAEEHGIESASSFEMPVMNLLGDGLKQMLRDCVLAVGSYGNIYDGTLEAMLPRSGANLLNADVEPGPQHFALPYK